MLFKLIEKNKVKSDFRKRYIHFSAIRPVQSILSTKTTVGCNLKALEDSILHNFELNVCIENISMFE